MILSEILIFQFRAQLVLMRHLYEN